MANSTQERPLEDCLESFCDEDKSSFYANGVTEELNPGLHIEGIGNVGMPISDHDAQRIITMSRQAPFGKGSRTIVDTSVRKTWELTRETLS